MAVKEVALRYGSQKQYWIGMHARQWTAGILSEHFNWWLDPDESRNASYPVQKWSEHLKDVDNESVDKTFSDCILTQNLVWKDASCFDAKLFICEFFCQFYTFQFELELTGTISDNKCTVSDHCDAPSVCVADTRWSTVCAYPITNATLTAAPATVNHTSTPAPPSKTTATTPNVTTAATPNAISTTTATTATTPNETTATTPNTNVTTTATTATTPNETTVTTPNTNVTTTATTATTPNETTVTTPSSTTMTTPSATAATTPSVTTATTPSVTNATEEETTTATNAPTTTAENSVTAATTTMTGSATISANATTSTNATMTTHVLTVDTPMTIANTTKEVGKSNDVPESFTNMTLESCPSITYSPYGKASSYVPQAVNNTCRKGTKAHLLCDSASCGKQFSVCTNKTWLPKPGALCKPHMKITEYNVPFKQKNKRAKGTHDLLEDLGKGNTNNFGICARRCTNTPGCTAYGWSSEKQHCELYQTFVKEMILEEAEGYKVAERSDVDDLE